MKPNKLEPDDARLAALLRESRAAPLLPPRFSEGVWRRIENAEQTGQSVNPPTWLESLTARLLRPRFAVGAVAVLVIVGAFSGARTGSDFARKDAQARYVTAVAPSILH